MPYLVANPKDRFSHDEAQMIMLNRRCQCLPKLLEGASTDNSVLSKQNNLRKLKFLRIGTDCKFRVNCPVYGYPQEIEESQMTLQKDILAP